MTSAPAHTPGPWSIVPYGDGDSLVIHHNDTDRVCFMATHGGSEDTWQRIQANAALIAAAPDLYEACVGVLARFEAGENLSSLEADWLREALAKARGESIHTRELNHEGGND